MGNQTTLSRKKNTMEVNGVQTVQQNKERNSYRFETTAFVDDDSICS